MPEVLYSKKRRGNAGTPWKNANSRVKPKPYWPGIEDDDGNDWNDEDESSNPNERDERRSPQISQEGDQIKKEESDDKKPAITPASKTAQHSLARTPASRSRRRKKPGANPVSISDKKSKSRLPQDLQVTEDPISNHETDEIDIDQGKKKPRLEESDSLAHSTPVAKAKMSSPQTERTQNVTFQDIAEDAFNDTEVFTTPKSIGTNSESITPKSAERNLHQALHQFPQAQQILSGIHNLLKGMIFPNNAAPESGSPTYQVDSPADTERELRHQQSIERLEIICDRQEKALGQLEGTRKIADESENVRQSQQEVQEEMEKLRKSLQEAQEKTESLTRSLETSQATVLNLQKAAGDREEREQQYVAKIDELSTISEQKESQIRQRDVLIEELQEEQKTIRNRFQTRIDEVLEMLRKKDALLRKHTEEIRRKDLRIRRLSETGPRVKSSPENESMPSFTQPEVVASNSYAYDAQREKSNPFDSSSSSSSKRRQNRTEPSFSSSDSSDSTPQKPSSKRTANLNFLVPSYDSLVKTGSSTKKPIIMIDSEEDWIESESESNED